MIWVYLTIWLTIAIRMRTWQLDNHQWNSVGMIIINSATGGKLTIESWGDVTDMSDLTIKFQPDETFVVDMDLPA